MADTTNILSFPGLGIGEFTLRVAAFSIFGRNIVWYGIIVTCGIIAGFFYVLYRSKFEGIVSDDVLDLAIFTIISAMVGARLYYVLTSPIKYDSFYEVIAIWNGGIAIYGGIIGGGLAALIVAMVKKLNIFKIFDMLAPGVMLGQIIGRWGNFVNAEAYGTETTLPWRMGIHKIGDYVYDPPIYVHPTFLYESLWNLVGFILINIFYKKKRFDGQIFFMYIAWYGFGRMLIEGLRTDSLMIFGVIRISQLVGLLSFIVGVTALAIFGAHRRKTEAAALKSDASLEILEGSETDHGQIADKKSGEVDTDKNDKNGKNKKDGKNGENGVKDDSENN